MTFLNKENKVKVRVLRVQEDTAILRYIQGEYFILPNGNLRFCETVALSFFLLLYRSSFYFSPPHPRSLSLNTIFFLLLKETNNVMMTEEKKV